MSERLRHGLVPKQGLTPEEFTATEALARECEEHDGARLKIVWEMMRTRPPDETNDFCFYEDGALAGYLSFDPNGAQIEITGMVRPESRRQGIGRALAAAAVEECRRRETTRLLLVCVRTSTAGTPFAAAIGARYTESEYRMELNPADWKLPHSGQVQIRQATPDDAALVAHFHRDNFGYDAARANDYVERVLEEPGSRVFIASLASRTSESMGTAAPTAEPIGAIGVIAEAGTAYLRGFSILAAHRGRGYGRQTLSLAVAALAAEGFTHQMLDVETQNANALGLYQSCGFQQTTCYDYYNIELH